MDYIQDYIEDQAAMDGIPSVYMDPTRFVKHRAWTPEPYSLSSSPSPLYFNDIASDSSEYSQHSLPSLESPSSTPSESVMYTPENTPHLLYGFNEHQSHYAAPQFKTFIPAQSRSQPNLHRVRPSPAPHRMLKKTVQFGGVYNIPDEDSQQQIDTYPTTEGLHSQSTSLSIKPGEIMPTSHLQSLNFNSAYLSSIDAPPFPPVAHTNPIRAAHFPPGYKPMPSPESSPRQSTESLIELPRTSPPQRTSPSPPRSVRSDSPQVRAKDPEAADSPRMSRENQPPTPIKAIFSPGPPPPRPPRADLAPHAANFARRSRSSSEHHGQPSNLRRRENISDPRHDTTFGITTIEDRHPYATAPPVFIKEEKRRAEQTPFSRSSYEQTKHVGKASRNQMMQSQPLDRPALYRSRSVASFPLYSEPVPVGPSQSVPSLLQINHGRPATTYVQVPPPNGPLPPSIDGGSRPLYRPIPKPVMPPLLAPLASKKESSPNFEKEKESRVSSELLRRSIANAVPAMKIGLLEKSKSLLRRSSSKALSTSGIKTLADGAIIFTTISEERDRKSAKKWTI